jgi:octaprenyl-diphosphate synthase
VVERKTATLFEAAARIGAVAGGVGPELESACARYGSSLGTAFQMIDDVLDYSGHVEELGKRLGDDLREGKVTLPLIHALSNSTARQREVIERAIREGNGDFVEVARIVQNSGSLDYVRECAEAEAARARSACATLPASDYLESLISLTAFAVDRDR